MKRVMTSDFRARFNGTCRACRQFFYLDDLIAYNEDDQLVHAECRDLVPRDAVATCEVCHLEMPITGECC